MSTGVDQEVKLDSGMTEAVQVIGSPDGQWLAVAEFGGNIWLLALDDVASGSVQSSWRAVASEPGPVSSQFIAWSEDGWIFVHRNTGTGEEHEIRRINQSSGESELHARVPVDCVHVSMDADGRTFVCDVWTSDSDIWIAEGRQGAR